MPKLKPVVYDQFDLDDSSAMPEEFYCLDSAWAVDKAKKRKLLIIESNDSTLQLDFDTAQQCDKFINQLMPTFMQFHVVSRVWWTESVGGNKHVYVKLKEAMTVYERIAYQLALGSDTTRELLSLVGVKNNKKLSIVLFEKPDAVEHVIYAADGLQAGEIGAGDFLTKVDSDKAKVVDDYFNWTDDKEFDL